MTVDELLCNENSSIEEVMKRINANTKGTALIVDDTLKLVGVITDGDIRRLLLDGYGLNTKAKDVINKQFAYAKDSIEAQRILNEKGWKYKIVPIVDESMKVRDFVEYLNSEYIALANPQLNGNEYKYLMDAFLSTWISSTGKYVTMFEERFSKYCNVEYGVATSNGTTALHLALEALGIGKGDEVIVPDITFAATINAVLYTGATPVIVDIEEDSWCISPKSIEKAITDRTRAVIPVHVYGQPCNMDEICRIAKDNNLFIVEDCAEAHGAEFDGRRVGSFGDIACFSFFGNKVITTGEGGMCVTNKKELEEKMRILRDHGMSKEKKYYHEVIGFNYRMTNLQAAIGVAQLEHIDDILNWRERLERQYNDILGHIPGVIFQKMTLEKRKKITWLVSALVDSHNRDELIIKLKNNSIDARPFFKPLSSMEIYSQYAQNCITSKKISKMGINFPTTTEMNNEKLQLIASIIRSL